MISPSTRAIPNTTKEAQTTKMIVQPVSDIDG
jgi:hypothetical protein